MTIIMWPFWFVAVLDVIRHLYAGKIDTMNIHCVSKKQDTKLLPI